MYRLYENIFSSKSIEDSCRKLGNNENLKSKPTHTGLFKASSYNSSIIILLDLSLKFLEKYKKIHKKTSPTKKGRL